MDWPFVSVVIPTYGREDALHDTIKDCLELDYPGFEVIVVDQKPSHQPALQAWMDQLAADGKIQLHSLDWASLPGARNYAVRRAKGDILIFIDDDVRLEKNYIQTHAKVFLERPEVGAVAGRVFDRMKLADAKRYGSQAEQPAQVAASVVSVAAVSVSSSTAASGPLSEGQSCCGGASTEAKEPVIQDLPPEAMDPGIAWYHLDLVHTVKAQRVLTARGCNMSFRREIFDQHGIFFDERFEGSAVREESDFCLRIRKTGYQIWYEPQASLVHVGEESGGCHDVSTRSLKYQFTFYHNHFLMGLKNLTPGQCCRFFAKLFDCHVLGHPPCYKSPSLRKTLVRGAFYSFGFLKAGLTVLKSVWDHGQIYSRQDPLFGKSA